MSIPHTRLAFASMKPGVGKSTAATLLAFQLAQEGYRVGAVDGDRKSQTMREWVRDANKRANMTDDDGNPLGTPVPFKVISAAHEQIVTDANDELPEHDIRLYDLQGGDEELTRAVMADATDVILCTTMSKIDRAKVAAAQSAIKAGLLEYGRERENVGIWVLFGRVNAQRVVRYVSGGETRPTEEFEGYVNRYNANGLAVLDSWLPAKKAYEEVFKFHPSDAEVDMSYTRKLINELKEEKIIRG
jgi:cellulose biosynthesis protein BcsQ